MLNMLEDNTKIPTSFCMYLSGTRKNMKED